MIAIAMPIGNNPYGSGLELPFASNPNCSNEYTPKVLLHGQAPPVSSLRQPMTGGVDLFAAL
jgi:hypothetical protein